MLTDRINRGKQKTEVHNEIIGILGGNIPDAGRVRQLESWRSQKGNMRSCGSYFSEM